jgi:hypothetical protein
MAKTRSRRRRKPTAPAARRQPATRTVKAWAARINFMLTASQKRVERALAIEILRIGDELIKAKADLKRSKGHGAWLDLIDRRLKVNASTVQRIMKVAQNTTLRAAAKAGRLPAAWGTLVQLDRLGEEGLARALASGDVHQGTTRSEAIKIRVRDNGP